MLFSVVTKLNHSIIFQVYSRQLKL